MKTDVILCSVTMKDLTDYFRSRDGGSHNRRFAEKLAREVTKSPDKSKNILPSGWHEILHPPEVAFTRRIGFDLFNYGSGTQIIRTQENGPDAMSPNVRIEAV